MKYTGHRTAVHHLVEWYKEDLCILGYDKRYDGEVVFTAGKRFAEQFIFTHTNQQRFVSPEIFFAVLMWMYSAYLSWKRFQEQKNNIVTKQKNHRKIRFMIFTLQAVRNVFQKSCCQKLFCGIY